MDLASRGNERKYQENLGLSLSPAEWRQALMDPLVFSCEALRIIIFVYNQTAYQATPSAIAEGLGSISQPLHYAQVSAWNRSACRALYEKYQVSPISGQAASLIFQSGPRQRLGEHKRIVWQLQKNLVIALQEMV